MRYILRFRDSKTVIDIFNNLSEAKKAMELNIIEDATIGIYEEDFYEIVEDNN